MGAALQLGQLPSLPPRLPPLPRTKSTYEQPPRFYLIFGLLYIPIGLGQLQITSTMSSHVQRQYVEHVAFAIVFFLLSAASIGRYFAVRARQRSEIA